MACPRLGGKLLISQGLSQEGERGRDPMGSVIIKTSPCYNYLPRQNQVLFNYRKAYFRI